MTDGFEKFEADLAAMRPRALGDDVIAGIESHLAARKQSRWPDRFLVAVMGSGLLAACVIAAMLAIDSQSAPTPASSMNITMNRAAAADAPLAFARADSSWTDTLK